MYFSQNLLLSSIFLLLLMGACQPTPSSELSWPEVTSETRPWTRWWWHGSHLSREGITSELEAYQQAGLGGVEITPIYSVSGEEERFVPFLSSEWMDLLQFTLQEAQRLGLGVDMATGTGWPFGGPWVDLSQASQYLVFQTYTLTSGQSLPQKIQYQQEPILRRVGNPLFPGKVQIEDLVQPVADNENLQVLALDQVRFPVPLPLVSLMAFDAQGQSLNLTAKVDAEGKLNWTAPEGNWTLYAVFQGWHGKMVERAAPGGEGNVIDHFSTEAIQEYLARFDEAFQGQDLSALRAFFNDSYEVDDARGQANWTPQLLPAFRSKRGYDLEQHWPALFGVGDAMKQRQVLSDYRETISDLLWETFTAHWDQWAEAKGAITRNQAHGSPANILDLYAATDIPETEGTDLIRIKFATSAAHVSGKPLVSSESATWLNEHFRSNLADLKENIDRYFVGGVNHVFYHGTCYSPPADPWPGRLFYAAVHANPRNSLWTDFGTLNQYIARTQSFLQAGKAHNDILLYFPAYDRFATPGRELLDHFDGHGPNLESMPFAAVTRNLLAKGYALDYISDRQIRSLQTEEGTLHTGGSEFQTLIVPQCEHMPLATLEKLLALAGQGATILFHESLPQQVPGWLEQEKRQQLFRERLDGLVWQNQAEGLQMAPVEKGRVWVGADVELLLAQAEVEREKLVDQDLSYIRRQTSTGPIYFLANWSEKTVDTWVPLQTQALAITLFDPMTGKQGGGAVRQANGQTEVYLQLDPGASVILQTSPQEHAISWPYFQLSGETIALDGPWSLRFLQGGPTLPDSLPEVSLGTWTTLPGEGYGQFSGTARYLIQFPRPQKDSPGGWLLDLGKVHESARVKLNGREIATLIGPTYRVRLENQWLQETNLLEIQVSNLMANRIIDLDKRGVLWKRFYNINFPSRLRENRGEDGLFSASDWEPLPSGLLGPVSMRSITTKLNTTR